MERRMNSPSKLIEVTSYNPNWPKLFEDEASTIKQVIGDNCREIHHVGSTAVPGLDAKSIIDIIMVVKNPTDAISPLESIGYLYKGEVNIPFRYYFNKKENTPIHLHVYEKGNPEIELNLLFRNHLRTHPKAAAEYGDLKAGLLANASSSKKIPSRFSDYTLGKNTFIQKILHQVGFDKLRLMHCTHYAEWEAARIFRQKYFFDNVPIDDPYTWTFNHSEHIHFVLYKGIEIIGYTHLQRWPDQRMAMRIIVVDEPLRGQKFGGQLLELCEKWLKKQDIKSIHVQASPKAYTFYCQHSYNEMPFNDPDLYESDPQDIDMGKVL